jgi:glutamate-1-semialdehyde 2,1-aminomutase
MGVMEPLPGYLEGLKTLCHEFGALLIFDEVMSGFRVHPGGAQALYGVTPDLTCLGKVIGGGLPVGAYGGRADVMRNVAPEGAVYQAGTLSGNPLSVAAGLATLTELMKPGVFDRAVNSATEICEGLRQLADEKGVPLCVQQVGTMFTAFFTDANRVQSLADVQACDFDKFKAFFHLCRDQGVNLPPSQYEACFVSAAHDDAANRHALNVFRHALDALNGAC